VVVYLRPLLRIRRRGLGISRGVVVLAIVA
jgi:hypothetical protein